MATCKTCGTKLRVTAGWSVYGTDETGASHSPARCRDVLAARVAEVTRDERSAVERGNSLAREVQDERAHLGVERAAHALTRARLEAAERVVEAARPLLRAYWDDQIADYDDAVGRLIDSVAALDALPAAAPARAGDDS